MKSSVPMSTSSDLQKAADSLPPKQQRKLLDHIAAKLAASAPQPTNS